MLWLWMDLFVVEMISPSLSTREYSSTEERIDTIRSAADEFKIVKNEFVTTRYFKSIKCGSWKRLIFLGSS